MIDARHDMGVTNGFLRLQRDEFERLLSDSGLYESRCRDYTQSDYLYMDKVGYELLYILDPASVTFEDSIAEIRHPSLVDVLGGGDVVHRELDLGYGPAMIVSEDSLRRSIEDFEALSYDIFREMAHNGVLAELLMCEINEEMIRDYHWAYLQSLHTFIDEALKRDMVVLRY